MRRTVSLSDQELRALISAARLRQESADDNGESNDARRWLLLVEKLENALDEPASQGLRK